MAITGNDHDGANVADSDSRCGLQELVSSKRILCIGPKQKSPRLMLEHQDGPVWPV